MKANPVLSVCGWTARAIVFAAAIAAAPLAWADDDMMPPGPSMEDDPPMGTPMPMEDDPPMGGSMSEPAAGMPPMESKEGCGAAKGEMGRMGQMGTGGSATPAAAPPPALPAFAGTPGVYHMGSTGFFLDHPEHITLSAEQRTTLESIKVKSEKDQAARRQQIEQAEGEVWALTGAERPDSAAIDAKIRKVETLRSQQRLAYIQFVGEAAKALTDDQRRQLAGLDRAKATGPAPTPAPAHTNHAPDPGGK